MMTRLFVSGELINGATLELCDDKARYLGRVLRLRPGDTIRIFNGEGPEHAAIIETIARNTVLLRIGESYESQTESPFRVHLVQGVSRGERMDFVIQKATELGVKRVTPVLTEYGVVKLDAKRADKRREHWQAVAASACEQSGRVRVPRIDAPVALKTWFGDRPAETDAQLILRPGSATPLANIDRPETKVCLLIGPEGGFSSVEYEDADIAGFTPVSLGPRILRTETAAVAALSVLQAKFGDLA
ncbi:MAG: 16S rRNA (uracil(1498)-N(3))-methyltransferase [Woeseiaceae bacterium]|nr:16S rRNA (uracil(1498)-N(3))-methyltransferase [Woeseiaceae bacterium]